jgi:hypothetical protein
VSDVTHLPVWLPWAIGLAGSGPIPGSGFPAEVLIMRIEHLLPPCLLGRRPVRILVVGAGGTGSAIVMGLPYLHRP